MRKTTERFSTRKIQLILGVALLLGTGIFLLVSSLLPMPKASILHNSIPIEKFL